MSKQKKEQPEESIFENPEEENEELQSEEEERVYCITDPDWSEYVFGFFTPEGLHNGFPRCVELRRVAEILLGKIVDHDLDPYYIDKKMIVKCTLKFSETNSYDNVSLVVSGLADCDVQNTPAPYNRHLSSSADTKAEAKALRRALRVTFLSAEEMDTPSESGATEALDSTETNDQQLFALDMMAKRLDINVHKLAEQLDVKFNNLGCSKIAKKLQELQRSKKELDKELLGFENDWRNRIK